MLLHKFIIPRVYKRHNLNLENSENENQNSRIELAEKRFKNKMLLQRTLDLNKQQVLIPNNTYTLKLLYPLYYQNLKISLQKKKRYEDIKQMKFPKYKIDAISLIIDRILNQLRKSFNQIHEFELESQYYSVPPIESPGPLYNVKQYEYSHFRKLQEQIQVNMV